MPKKFSGGNSKATAARERKAEVKQKERTAKEKAAEDAKWQETDAKVLKKQREAEQRRIQEAEKAAKREELRKIKEQEEAEMRRLNAKKDTALGKVTQYQLEKTKERIAEEERQRKAAANAALTDMPEEIPANLNRVRAEMLENGGVDASTVDEALEHLSVNETPEDKHPEKRAKAAFRAFEEMRLAELKESHPTLKRSQLKEMLWKEWQKHPDNPRSNIQQ
jgi:hypothetical protein